MHDIIQPGSPASNTTELPAITRVEVVSFFYTVQNAGRDERNGKLFYADGETTKLPSFAVRLTAEDGSEGSYVAHMGGRPSVFTQTLNVAAALLGEKTGVCVAFNEFAKKQLQTLGGLGAGALEICSWDLLGKHLNVPIGSLIGRLKDQLPTYASLLHCSDLGNLTTDSELSDAVKRCLDSGTRGVKFRGWPGKGPERYKRAIEIADQAAAEQPGAHLFLDPGCDLRTFADALMVGHAADDAGLFWLEDMMRDAGHSIAAQKRLRERIATPLLSGEHVRGLEAKAEWITSGATDFIRADPELDGGISECLKIAHLAEAFGMDVEIHGSGPAHRAIVAAIRNTNFYELGLVMPDGTNIHAPTIYRCGYSDGFSALNDNGQATVPKGPGLGVSYDWDAISRDSNERHIFE